MKKRITTYQYIIYGMGVAYFMLDQIFNQWLQYYYIPPTGSSLKPILSSTMLLVAFILIRMVDAIADLFVGVLSDNSKSKMGKRSFFMFIGGLPLGFSTILFFYPPQNNDIVTFIYFILIGTIYFVAYTLVGAPYNAMVADFSTNNEERINLSTSQSIFRLLFTAIPLIFSGKLIAIFGKGNDIHGIRMTVLLFSVVATIFIYLCIFLLKEPTLSVNNTKKEKVSFRKAITYLYRKDVIFYFIGFFFFFSGFNVVRNVLTYYSNLVLNKDISFVTIISAVMFGSAALFFPITNILAKKIGNRLVMVIDLIGIILPLSYLTLTRTSNVTVVLIMIAITGAGFSGAAFICPPAMLSEIASDLSKKHNTNIEGFMFGIQGFFLKIAFLVQASVTTIGIVFRSEVVDGKKTATYDGILLSMGIAIILLIISTIFYYINKTKLED